MSTVRSGSIGFVANVKAEERLTTVSVCLNYQELRERSLLLGEFVKVRSGIYYRREEKTYLGMVTRAYYRPVAYADHERSLALGRLNNQALDEHAVRQMNFLHFDVAILGQYEVEQGRYEFFSSTRVVPSLIDVSVEFLEEDELLHLINVTLETDVTARDDLGEMIDIGALQYGSSPSHKMEAVKKSINVHSFVGRRTANFGKTGFGKSNENKVIVSVVTNYYPDTSFLIFDLNQSKNSRQ